jgi:hypothetical protein
VWSAFSFEENNHWRGCVHGVASTEILDYKLGNAKMQLHDLTIPTATVSFSFAK